MPISCHMRDLGFSDSEAPAAKCPTPKPTHIGHFSSSAAHRKVRGRGGRGGAASLRVGGGGTAWALQSAPRPCTVSLRGGRGGAKARERRAQRTLGTARCGAALQGGGGKAAAIRGGGHTRRMMRAAALRAAARLRRWRD